MFLTIPWSFFCFCFFNPSSHRDLWFQPFSWTTSGTMEASSTYWVNNSSRAPSTPCLLVISPSVQDQSEIILKGTEEFQRKFSRSRSTCTHSNPVLPLPSRLFIWIIRWAREGQRPRLVCLLLLRSAQHRLTCPKCARHSERRCLKPWLQILTSFQTYLPWFPFLFCPSYSTGKPTEVARQESFCSPSTPTGFAARATRPEAVSSGRNFLLTWASSTL